MVIWCRDSPFVAKREKVTAEDQTAHAARQALERRVGRDMANSLASNIDRAVVRAASWADAVRSEDERALCERGGEESRARDQSGHPRTSRETMCGYLSLPSLGNERTRDCRPENKAPYRPCLLSILIFGTSDLIY